MTPTIEQVIAAIPAWAGRAVDAEAIAAGLTNANWKVTVDGTPHFVRIPGAATDLLAVDRANERHNTRAAATAGVGPPVLHELPEWDVFVLAWVDARTMSIETLGAPGIPARVAEALRQLHAGPRFRDDFDMFRTTERYLRVVDERSILIPNGYRDRLDRLPRIEAALGVHPLPTVPCHNDLLAENYLDDGQRLWLVDYEYSGNNDPTFELGNIWRDNGLSLEQLEELVTAYYGSRRPEKVARAHLQAIVSQYGWALWGFIQQAMSPLEFDFWGWGMERFEGAVEEMRAPGFTALLDEATRGDGG